jgi:NADH:ubiquinone oxidoreductase subunit 6 (subunit J)
MTKRARAVTAIVGAVSVFVAAFAVMGYHIGIEYAPDDLVVGWPAALAVGGLAAAMVLVVAVTGVVVIGLCEWVSRGRS